MALMTASPAFLRCIARVDGGADTGVARDDLAVVRGIGGVDIDDLGREPRIGEHGTSLRLVDADYVGDRAWLCHAQGDEGLGGEDRPHRRG